MILEKEKKLTVKEKYFRFQYFKKSLEFWHVFETPYKNVWISLYIYEFQNIPSIFFPTKTYIFLAEISAKNVSFFTAPQLKLSFERSWGVQYIFYNFNFSL